MLKRILSILALKSRSETLPARCWGIFLLPEYRKVIVGLIFLRYISSAFEKRYNELVAEGDGFEDEPDVYLMENILFVPEKARWSVVFAAAHTPEIGSVIDEAMRAIEEEKKTLKNVLPKNYASPDLDKRVFGDVVDRKHRDFTDEDIQKLSDTFKAFQDGTLEEVKEFSAIATIQEIAKQDYILTPGRYVGIEEQEDDGEPFDEKMKRLTAELSDMFAKSHKPEDDIRDNLGGRLGMLFKPLKFSEITINYDKNVFLFPLWKETKERGNIDTMGAGCN